MAAPARREAQAVLWRSPQDQPCGLTPRDNGVIAIDIVDQQVNIHGRHCLYKVSVGETSDAVETDLAELEITVPLSCCQIHWKLVERKETEEIERSIYFRG